MEEGIDVQKQTRREQIMTAAFELSSTCEKWSLSDIAKKINVSKTALYRHFKNREDIEDEMEAQFRIDLVFLLDSTAKKSSDVQTVRTALIHFFREHNGYLFQLIKNIFMNPHYDKDLYQFLVQHSQFVAKSIEQSEKYTQEKKLSWEVSLVKNIVSIIIVSYNLPQIRPLQDTLIKLLHTGLPHATLPTKMRLAELAKLATIEKSELKEENKLFSAIAKTINEEGIAGCTIEKIAANMGMAKSSLYFYFAKKEEMLAELVWNETTEILRHTLEKLPYANGFIEQIFMLMCVQANYLRVNPDVIPVFNWIRYETIFQRSVPNKNIENIDCITQKFSTEELFPKTPQGIREAMGMLKLASILSTSIIINAQKNNDSSQIIEEKIAYMFTSMIQGDKEFI